MLMTQRLFMLFHGMAQHETQPHPASPPDDVAMPPSPTDCAPASPTSGCHCSTRAVSPATPSCWLRVWSSPRAPLPLPSSLPGAPAGAAAPFPLLPAAAGFPFLPALPFLPARQKPPLAVRLLQSRVWDWPCCPRPQCITCDVQMQQQACRAGVTPGPVAPEACANRVWPAS